MVVLLVVSGMSQVSGLVSVGLKGFQSEGRVVGQADHPVDRVNSQEDRTCEYYPRDIHLFSHGNGVYNCFPHLGRCLSCFIAQYPELTIDRLVLKTDSHSDDVYIATHPRTAQDPLPELAPIIKNLSLKKFSELKIVFEGHQIHSCHLGLDDCLTLFAEYFQYFESFTLRQVDRSNSPAGEMISFHFTR